MVSAYLKESKIWSGNYDNISDIPDHSLPSNLPYTGGFNFPKWEGDVWVESGNVEEINAIKIKRALEIDFEYTERISKLMAKHTEKFIEALELGEIYVIPQIAKDEKQSLKDECRALIFQETGITDYTYRESIPKLATINL